MSSSPPSDGPLPTSPESGRAGPDAAIPCHDAATLTNGGQVAHICQNGQSYVLRITRQGKLILTK